jgi:hypothetical protein
MVHRANRLLSESTLILCTLREQADGRTNAPVTSPGLRSIPEPHAFSTVVFYGVKFFAVKPRNSAKRAANVEWPKPLAARDTVCGCNADRSLYSTPSSGPD